MESNGLVSIIIPVFNVRSYLVESLESAIGQTYQNLEIIIVDDGSTDGSANICDEYARRDKRICVIHQQNKGLSGARNAGLDIMSGDAVAFLDSDDALFPSFVELMLDAMTNSGVDMVICDYTAQHTSGEMLPRENSLERKPYITIGEGVYNRKSALQLLAEGAFSHYSWNKLYRNKLWRDTRFPEGHVYEDVDTTFRILDQCNRIYVLDKPLYQYRKRRGSIIDTRSKGNIRDCILACSHLESYVKENMPDIFTMEQLSKVKLPMLKGMIIYYARFSGETEEKDNCGELKQRIIGTIEEIGIDNCDIVIKVCYWMLRHCPMLVRFTYPFYHVVGRALKYVRD